MINFTCSVEKPSYITVTQKCCRIKTFHKALSKINILLIISTQNGFNLRLIFMKSSGYSGYNHVMSSLNGRFKQNINQRIPDPVVTSWEIIDWLVKEIFLARRENGFVPLTEKCILMNFQGLRGTKRARMRNSSLSTT